ncbi:MAG TPA: lipoyl(octanoyl) transferase LipB [Planctomycetes bacterium]|nr:lipoyl(octanoyl) transferase LipB [Planctomycetota bacterium]
MTTELPPLEVRRLGRTEYRACHAEQLRLVEARAAGEVGDILLLTEHEPVVTVGRGASVEAASGVGVDVVEVERGGEATYHGPGQLVAYPILLLEEGRRDLHRYLRDLEEVVIGVLDEFGIQGRREAGLTGVWIGEQKVCSIGVAVRRWVTYHGLALNLHTELEPFHRFQPCGLDPRVMTRAADHGDVPPTTVLAEVLLVKHLCRVFGRDPAVAS